MLRKILRFSLLAGASAPIVLSSMLAGGAGSATASSGVSLPALPPTATVLLHGTVPGYSSSAPNLGPASPAAPARALIALQHRNQAQLLHFVAQVSNPRSRLYGHYLTPSQFVETYAPSDATVQRVESFARSFGLHVGEVPSNRAYVYVTGTVTQMEQAFGTTIELYRLGGRTVQAPERALRLPQRIAVSVTGVEGLDTGDRAHPTSAVSTPPSPAYVNAGPMSSYWGQQSDTTDPGWGGQSTLPYVVQGYDAKQLEGAYGVAGAIAHGLDGRGQTVAVIDAYSSPTIVSDADEWSNLNGLPKPNLVIKDNAAERDQPEGAAVPSSVPDVGGLNLQDPEGWFGEETLDVEAVHTMAPGATIVVQSAASDLNVDLERAQNDVVSKDEAQIISNSYGGSSDTTNSTSDGYWQEAAAQGIGVYFSSGDSGDQTAGGTDPTARSVDSGPNSPYVTAVGGTTLGIGAADNYEFETYWGTDTATLSGRAWGPLSFQSGGGGGTSGAYAEPSYQQGVVPSQFSSYWKGNSSAAFVPGRVVPDVAMLGDPNSGFLMGQTEDYTAYSNPDGYDLPGDTDQFGEYRIGGTSLSSPLFAGMIALADQAAGHPHGFANPALYEMYGQNAATFHDISAPATQPAVVRINYLNNTNSSGGTETLLRTAGNLGTLASIPGYDDSTGMGSPNGVAFLSGLAPGSALIADLDGTSQGGGQGATGPAGTTGPAGPAGGIGPVGPAGGSGQRGAQGAAGHDGPAGVAGSTGPQGPAGAPGKSGAIELVSCTTRKAGRHGARREHCTTRLISGILSFSPDRALARLARGRAIVATGSGSAGRLVLHAERVLGPGYYTLILERRSGRRWVTTRERVRIS